MPKVVVSSVTPASPESCVAQRSETCELPLATSRLGLEAGQKCRRPRPRGSTCQWTAELDCILTTAWTQGGPRAGRRALKRERPSWSWSAVRKHASALGLCKPKPPRWTKTEIDQLLWSIDSNASLSLIARRLGRSVAAVRKRLWDLGYKAESLGGYKVKELAEMLLVSPGRVQYWVEENLLFTKGGRITESSLTNFLGEHPTRIPFDTLRPEMQNWLREMGYAKPAPQSALAATGGGAGTEETKSIGGFKPVDKS